MILRNLRKDHLAEHTWDEFLSVEVGPQDQDDHLKFWTNHPTKKVFIDLTLFAEGEKNSPRGGNAEWAGPFTGRPVLIRELAPSVKTACMSASRATAIQYVHCLRAWWRLLDAVEQAAAQIGQTMIRVESVTQLTQIHAEFARADGKRRAIGRIHFLNFLRLVNSTLTSLGKPIIYWKTTEDPVPTRRLLPDENIAAIRIRLKQEWEGVLRWWSLVDHMGADGFVAQTEHEAMLLAHYRHITEIQKEVDKVIPTTEDLRRGMSQSGFRSKTGLQLSIMRRSIFPDRWDADTAFHLCLAHSGWNPATLFSLDVTRSFLSNHPRDPVARYLLVGVKTRAGDKEQPIEGLWKTKAGPGSIIRAWMERTAALRGPLQSKLSTEKSHYKEMLREGANEKELIVQRKAIQRLEEGCRSVWIYLGARGEVEWLSPESQHHYRLKSKNIKYLQSFLERLNSERTGINKSPVPHVCQSDFRDMYASYVWKAGGGNILAVMRALRHSRLRTTEGYLDNNILNAERDEKALLFLNNLFSELSIGRLDIAILAHLQQYGAVTDDMKNRLFEYRKLQRSRMGVACKDPRNPPRNIQPNPDGKLCSVQRCLLCREHSIILPESMPGIVMRIVELETIKASVPIEAWSGSLVEELKNGLDVLKVFAPSDVRSMREHWETSIASGQHFVPGYRQPKESYELPFAMPTSPSPFENWIS